MLLIFVLAMPAWAVVFSNASPITLNDATTIGTGNPYSSDITVTGMTGTVTNVTVTLTNVNHTFPDDFDVLLVAPGGNNLILMSDVGGGDDVTNRTITFSDAASGSLPDGTTLNSGTFLPTNIGAGDTFPAPAPAPSANTTFAAAFAGIVPNGVWSLFVVDDAGADMGSIGNGWSITITSSGTAATTFTNGTPIYGGDGGRGRATPYPSTITVAGLTGGITSLTVTLTGLDHLNPDDLDIWLVGPTGKNIILLSDAGGTADVVGATVTFNDAAATQVPDAGPLVSGTFRPTNFGTADTIPDTMGLLGSAQSAGNDQLGTVFNGTDPNGVWKLYIVDDATTSAGILNGGWSLDITAGGSFGSKRFTSADFNGDGRTDVSVYRPSEGKWWIRKSDSWANLVVVWGQPGDIPAPGDYDGDRKTDECMFRPSTGQWITFRSSTNTVSFVTWGSSTDKVVPSDYNGDGITDVAVYRPSNGTWYILRSGTNSPLIAQWGLSTDLPVPGDYDGDGSFDIAIFRPSTGQWFGILSSIGNAQATWGISGDKPVQADYDGDGQTDLAVFRPSDGNWYIYSSDLEAARIVKFGLSDDIPVPGDYDGDSMTDVAMFRPSNGSWYIHHSGTNSTSAAFRQEIWGTSGDVPVPAALLPLP
jgi:subtilisin-like proprotein convertase family protein